MKLCRTWQPFPAPEHREELGPSPCSRRGRAPASPPCPDLRRMLSHSGKTRAVSTGIKSSLGSILPCAVQQMERASFPALPRFWAIPKSPALMGTLKSHHGVWGWGWLLWWLCEHHSCLWVCFISRTFCLDHPEESWFGHEELCDSGPFS